MTETAGQTLVSDDELRAALTEAADHTDEIPSLDEAAISIIPVPPPPNMRPMPRDPLPGAGAPRSKREEPAGERFEADAPESEAPRQRSKWTARLAAACGRVLSLFDSLGGWLPPGMRAILGWMSVVTVLVSLAARLALPAMFPSESAITRLHKRAALVLAGTLPQREPKSKHGEAEQKESAHGGGKGETKDEGHGGGHGKPEGAKPDKKKSKPEKGHGETASAEHGKEGAKSGGHGEAGGEKPKKEPGHGGAEGKKSEKPAAEGHGSSAHGGESKEKTKSKSTPAKKGEHGGSEGDSHGAKNEPPPKH